MLAQFILLALMFLGLGVTIAKHGEPTEHDGWVTFISMIINLSLLWWGGFFYCFLS